ncbi:DUF882 domain-containing protein [Azospirillum sp. SYSU D00513]|uniref:DUF882 domain-containing protein n=1 Tax=Azospirillum sp. SYSU D00513 TaxID=2812561 RepID=UPI001A96567B|nr:DUF882 domain-containing protein [Azospirillum sp. SYSU D00513]
MLFGMGFGAKPGGNTGIGSAVDIDPGRRRFLTFAAAATVTAAVPAVLLPAEAEAAPRTGGMRRLALHNINTRESFDGVYWAQGAYRGDMLRKLDVLLRDHRAKQVCKFDPRLFDVLTQVQQRLGTDEPFQVICGYRSRRTNAMARRRSRGVAKESYHTRGMAIDVALPGVDLKRLADVARDLQAGGVGYYPKSGFVHIDVGPVRTW